MKPECLFCRILSGEIEADKVYEDEFLAAFRDVSPQAPVHVLIVPREHIPGVPEIGPGERDLVGRMIETAGRLAGELGIEKQGYRLVINSGPAAGQAVFHLHLHLLGGRSFGWPPG